MIEPVLPLVTPKSQMMLVSCMGISQNACCSVKTLDRASVLSKGIVSTLIVIGPCNDNENLFKYSRTSMVRTPLEP